MAQTEPLTQAVVAGQDIDWGIEGLELTTGLTWSASAKIRDSEKTVDYTPDCTLTERGGTPGTWDLRITLDSAVTAVFEQPTKPTQIKYLYLDVLFSEPGGIEIVWTQYIRIQVRWTSLNGD
ncbi:MAG: hypothetical protein WC100_06995 [Sterolibacterium sp.]